MRHKISGGMETNAVATVGYVVNILYVLAMIGDIVMIDNFSYKLRGAEYKTGE